MSLHDVLPGRAMTVKKYIKRTAAARTQMERAVLKALGLEKKRGFQFPPGLNAAQKKNLIHFLHIGKCAGTTTKRFIQWANTKSGELIIMPHGHAIKLSFLPEDARYFFSIRDPITRFCSGFYERKRKGQPRLYSEWSEKDRLAFTYFPEANDLAENLFSDSSAGLRAFMAMKCIGHVSQHQHSWFDNVEEVLTNRPPICILRQEQLETDLRFLARKLGLPEDFKLEADPVRSHRYDYTNAPPLSSRAVENLKLWYAADLQFHKLANAWIADNQK
jgi:hypothetical protein